MNIVKQLKKQIELGKTVGLENGNTVKPEEVNNPLMKKYLAGIKKKYLAGIKNGEISPDVSFTDYCENNKTEILTVQEIIDFIEGNE